MTDERLEQIRELAEKATPGPWVRNTEYPIGEGAAIDSTAPDLKWPKRQIVDDGSASGEYSSHVTEADFDFIAESRTAIPELLALLDEQKKRIEELERGFTVKHMTALRNAIAATDPNIIDDDDLVAQPAKLLARAYRAEQDLKEYEESRKKARPALYELCMHFRAAPSQTKVNHAFEEIKRYVAVAEVEARESASLPTPPQTQKWIPVGERLPEFATPVDAIIRSGYDGEALRIVAERNDGDDGWLWHICTNTAVHLTDLTANDFELDDDYRVTHWHPLPTPPEEETDPTAVE